MISDQGKKVLIEKLENYCENFGSMNKNDFEVLVFHALTVDSDNAMSNFDLSRWLRIPESKVKRLRYEADLKYGDDDYRKEKLAQLNNLLTKVSYKKDSTFIEFVVEDLALRQFLDNLLKKHNRFSDSSFNSEVVKINLDDLAILLSESTQDPALCNKLLEKAGKELKETVSFKELVPDIIRAVANTSSIIADVTIPGLIGLVGTYSKSLINLFKERREKKASHNS